MTRVRLLPSALLLAVLISGLVPQSGHADPCKVCTLYERPGPAARKAGVKPWCIQWTNKCVAPQIKHNYKPVPGVLPHQRSGRTIRFPFFVMPAKAGTHDKIEICLMVAVGPGLRRDDEGSGYHLNES